MSKNSQTKKTQLDNIQIFHTLADSGVAEQLMTEAVASEKTIPFVSGAKAEGGHYQEYCEHALDFF